MIEALLNGDAVFKRTPLFSHSANPLRALFKLVFRNRFYYEYRKTMRCRLVEHLLLKDPIACLSAEWLHRRFGMDVVVLVRHPCAFVASIRRLGWEFPWDDIMSQPALVETHLDHLLAAYDLRSLDLVASAALAWTCLYLVLTKFVHRNPGIFFVRHEDISLQPTSQIAQLCAKTNLPYSLPVTSAIAKLMSDANPADAEPQKTHSMHRNSAVNAERWKCTLSHEQIDIVRHISEPVSSAIYAEQSWE